jgi:hypothetical protein
VAWHTEFDKGAETWRLCPGDYVEREIAPLEERRMIVIPAVPSSGTSMVAGVLHHLGVHMGNVHSERWTRLRGYEQFEDLDIGMFTWRQNGPMDHLVNQRIRFREYMNYRFATQAGRLGVKTLPTIWMSDGHVEQWPIDILDVRRPLQTALDKDIERMATRPEREPGKEPFTAWESMARYGGVASMAWARDALLKFHPPRLTVDYDEFRANPPVHIEKIVEVFGLEPTDRQMTEALLSVRT